MSITIKQAFEKLAMVTGAAVKNPWFVGRNLNQAFADIAKNIEGGGGAGSTVEVTQVLTSGTKIATITVDDTPTDLYAPSGGASGQYELIWTNPDLTAGIDSSTPINITDADKYTDFIFEIIANANYTNKGIMTSAGNLGSIPNQVGVFGNSNNLPAYFYRTFTTTSTSLILSAPYKKELGGWSDTSDVNTNYIPVKIYGIK